VSTRPAGASVHATGVPSREMSVPAVSASPAAAAPAVGAATTAGAAARALVPETLPGPEKLPGPGGGHVLALDEGTTSARALVFAPDGRITGLAQREYTQHFPQPGHVEHDPLELWEAQSAVAEQALRAAGLRARDLAGVGITNQRETTVVWERATGRPVHRAIVWQDRRTARACDALRAAGHEPLVRERTGLLLDPYFSGTKLAWVLDQVPGARARAEAGELAFGTIDTWLLWQLTGGAVHATDPSNASRTLLFGLRSLDWDDELLALLRVPRAVLPEVRPSSGDFGAIVAPHALAGARVLGIAGDQQAALFGQRCTSPGLSKNTYGTGCFLLRCTGGEPASSRHRLLSSVAWTIGGRTTYALEGSVFTGGAIVQWLRDGLQLIGSAAEIEPLARSVADSGGVVLVPALTGLGAPQWDPDARGALLGLTRGTTRAHLARAALEGIAHQVADLVAAMDADAGAPLSELRVDGGAARNDLLLQIQADLLGVPVVRPAVTEATALGAAYLAGLPAGARDDGGRGERRFEPSLPGPERVAQRERWRQGLARAGHWTQAGRTQGGRLEQGGA
jgi:glycerol kinase